MATNNPKVVFKVLILGDAMVGKSCFLQRYADNRYVDSIAPTIGVDYRPVYKTFRGLFTKLMIWDTAGQEKFKSITKSFYHGAHGAVLVYDVTQKDTLYGLGKWVSELRHVCSDIPVVIVGNKIDSKLTARIPDEDISSYIDEMGFSDRHVLTSARTAENVEKAFELLTGFLMDSIEMYSASDGNKLILEAKHSRGCPC